MKEIWRPVFYSLENERSLDINFRQRSDVSRLEGWLPNYKVMKQIALRNRFGFIYRLLVYVALMMIPIFAIYNWLYSLIASFLVDHKQEKKNHIVATTAMNIPLIEGALAEKGRLAQNQFDYELLNLRELASRLGAVNVIACIWQHIKLLSYILIAGKGRRLDLILHSRDAMCLLMFTKYIISRPEHHFVTEDHYQRWAYLLSHHSHNFSLVQHGALGPKISFTHPFGIIHTLYIREPHAQADFEEYYSVKECLHVSVTRPLVKNPCAINGVFLASSFPYVDNEIDLLKQLKIRDDIRIIVKFHPAHHYDSRKQQLIDLADYICSEDEFPACMIFVSYNSFTENDYIYHGVPTFSIERSGGVLNTVNAIVKHLDDLIH